MKQRHKVAIGLGANLGDRLENLKRAAEKLSEEFLEEVVSSSVYESEPWGIEDQPRFLNAVIVGTSEWKPPAMVNYLKNLERELGRTPGVRNGPREIDLDLLAWGEESWNQDGVEVPHPRLPFRDFVLLPLAEVWAQWKHPALGQDVPSLVRDCLENQPATAKVFAAPLLSTTNR